MPFWMLLSEGLHGLFKLPPYCWRGSKIGKLSIMLQCLSWTMFCLVKSLLLGGSKLGFFKCFLLAKPFLTAMHLVSTLVTSNIIMKSGGLPHKPACYYHRNPDWKLSMLWPSQMLQDSLSSILMLLIWMMKGCLISFFPSDPTWIRMERRGDGPSLWTWHQIK